MANAPSACLARRGRVVALVGAMLAAGAFVGFYQIFSQFKEYDDEGYVMISVQSVLEGQPLYREVYTQYGPFYYLYKGALHRLTGLPVTHDVVRMMTIAAWLAATLLCALFVYRLSGSLLLAAATFVLTFKTLWMVTNEPGHPQELCALLLAASVYLSSLASTAGRLRWGLPAMGALTAALVLTKVNVGLYATVALAGAIVAGAQAGMLRRAAVAMMVCLAALAPIVLMRAHLDTEWVLVYAVVAALACCSTMMVAGCAARGGAISVKLGALAVTGFVASALMIFAVTLALGTSAGEILDGVLLNPLRFVESMFIVPLLLPSVAAPVAAVAALAAIGYCVVRLGWIGLPQRVAAAMPVVGGIARLLFVVGVTVAALREDTRDLLAFAAPWLWLTLAVDDEAAARSAGMFARAAVALTSAFEMLQAYPVGGSQQSIASFLTVPAAALCAYDLWRQLQASRFSLSPWIARVGAAMVSLAIVVEWCYLGYSFQAAYWSLSPLDLPGAHWIRVREAEAAVMRCVSKTLHDTGDTFFTIPGLNSFYFWAERKPPTGLNTTIWMVLLDDAQQRRVIEQLEKNPRAVLVRYPKQIVYWLGRQDVQDKPLVRYLQEHFQPVAAVGEYEFWVRSGERFPGLVEAASVRPMPAEMAARLGELGLAKDPAPNVLLQLRATAAANRSREVARVIIINAANGALLADSREAGIHGLKVLDAQMRPVNLPLSGNWMHEAAVGTLYLIPHEPWPAPQKYDYSRVLVGLIDEHDGLSAALPLALPLTQAAQ